MNMYICCLNVFHFFMLSFFREEGNLGEACKIKAGRVDIIICKTQLQVYLTLKAFITSRR